MTLGQFRWLTQNVSDDSELVIWVYFEVLGESGEVLNDISSGVTDFDLDISEWVDNKKALHFTVDSQKTYDDMKATRN